jgi:hypothetical protein
MPEEIRSEKLMCKVAFVRFIEKEGTTKTEGSQPIKEDFKNVPECEAVVMKVWDMIKARNHKLLIKVHFKEVPEYEAMVMTIWYKIKDRYHNLLISADCTKVRRVEAIVMTFWDKTKAR